MSPLLKRVSRYSLSCQGEEAVDLEGHQLRTEPDPNTSSSSEEEDEAFKLSGGVVDENVSLGRTQQLSAVAQIETLPPELLFYLSRFLDLAGLVVFSTATCRTLRVIFSQFDRELLFLEPPHRLNLAEWREAAQTIERFGLTRRHCTVMEPFDAAESDYAKASGDVVGKITQAMHELTRDDSLVDLDLFQAVLKFLAGDKWQDAGCNVNMRGVDPSKNTLEPGASESRGNRIRTLHLTGWHGIAGAFLLQQLRLQPLLKDVCTIVKTERADNRIWEQAAADDQKALQRLRGPNEGTTPPAHSAAWLRFARPGYRSDMSPTPLSFEATRHFHHPLTRFDRCCATQIIVQVGRRRPHRQGQAYLRGEGLQIGYQGYCIDVTTARHLWRFAANPTPISAQFGSEARGCSGSETRVPPTTKDASLEDDISEPYRLSSGVGNNDGHSRQNATNRRLHIILQGREELGVEGEDRRQNEEMFERSIVTCNRCKERIMF